MKGSLRLYEHEIKMNFKSFLIWTLCVGLMCFGCILLYGSVEESLEELDDVFANMGAMSTAFGMDRISINTLTGYYATEIAMIHSLGGAMFAAVLGSNLLSKEEYGHTSEFLVVMPVSRTRIVISKALAMLSYVVLFQIICTVGYMLGFAFMGEKIEWNHLLILALTQTVLLVEVAVIAFAISAFSRKNNMGIGIGFALLLFAADIMCRIVPAIENVKYITPFYYCNATDIYTGVGMSVWYYIIAAAVIGISFAAALGRYRTKDITA